jgi:hypothetical protein
MMSFKIGGTMKKLCMILPLALILCFMVGCQDKAAMAELEEFKAQAEVEEQNKAIVERLIEELNKGNPEIIEEVYASISALFQTFSASTIMAFTSSSVSPSGTSSVACFWQPKVKQSRKTKGIIMSNFFITPSSVN